jgi:hypothetical protein
MYYRLTEDKKVVPVEMLEWARAFEKDRLIKKTELDNGVLVSTVFLGLDHQYGNGPPLVFETMIFGTGGDEYQTRCSTYEQALEMHQTALLTVPDLLINSTALLE